MTFDINNEELTVLAKADMLIGGLQPDKHYTFNLTVGKEKVEINTVNVTEWTSQYIDGCVAK